MTRFLTGMTYVVEHRALEWHQLPPSLHLPQFVDASGSWGCGTAWSQEWLQLKWPPSLLSENIAVMS